MGFHHLIHRSTRHQESASPPQSQNLMHPTTVNFRINPTASGGTGQTRRGVQILEGLLVLPILLIAFVAFCQFGPLLIVQSTLTSAAEETAREISKMYAFDINDPSGIAKAEGVANTILFAAHGLSTASPGLLLIMENADGVACSGDTVLDGLYCPATTSVTDLDETRVTLILNMNDSPVPQVLQTFGVDISDQRYQVAAVVRKDCAAIP